MRGWVGEQEKQLQLLPVLNAYGELPLLYPVSNNSTYLPFTVGQPEKEQMLKFCHIWPPPSPPSTTTMAIALLVSICHL